MNEIKTVRPSTGEPRNDPLPWDVSGLRDTCEEWLLTYFAASPKTIAIYRDAIERRMIPFLEGQGIFELSDVTPKALTLFLVHEWERPRQRARRDGDRSRNAEGTGRISTEVIVRTYEIMRTFFKWAVAQGYLERQPMDGVRRPARSKLVREAVSTEEAKRMMAFNREKDDPVIRSRDNAIMTLLLGTGLRANELRMMRIQDIDWANRRVTIWNAKGEGQVQTRVRLSPKAYQALREWLRARQKYKVTSDWVWISQRRQHMTYQALWHVVRRLGEYAGVEGAYPHQIRHTAATQLYMETKDIMLVKQFMRHSKVATTERYLKRLGIDLEQTDYRTPDEWLT